MIPHPPIYMVLFGKKQQSPSYIYLCYVALTINIRFNISTPFLYVTIIRVLHYRQVFRYGGTISRYMDKFNRRDFQI